MPVRSLLHRLGVNRRLLWLVAAALAVVVIDLALRAWSQHQALATETRDVRQRIASLAASSDQMDWARRTAAVDAAHRALASQLWHSPSEAQAQARLRDWLTAALRTAGVQRPTLSLLPALAAPSTSGRPAAAAPVFGSTAAVDAAPRLLRVRASVVFELGPNAVERALQQVENGGQLARVDNLTMSTRSRRVEMLVSVPVLLQPEGT